MIVNKKLDRFKQWAGERMGGEVKTSVSDDFKAMEEEMALRHEGMERLQRTMTSYVKSLSKTKEAEDRERILPVAYMGSALVSHGDEFDNESVYGQCLTSMGRTNERIARIQENYVTRATSSWLESLDRSLAQMKEYQSSRKKLEQRRLAYDASLSKMQKAKREDFRVEEELRSQKAKYEESSEDVYRRMQDIKESEDESVTDLGAFLDAELEYYDRCREVLLQAKRDWPGASSTHTPSNHHQNGRHPDTSAGFGARYDDFDDGSYDDAPTMPSRSTKPGMINSDNSPRTLPRVRPGIDRSSTFEVSRTRRTSPSPAAFDAPAMVRTPTDPPPLPKNRSQLRPVHRVATQPNPGSTYADAYGGDPSDDSTASNESAYLHGGRRDRSVSPATSYGSTTPSRNVSSSTLNTTYSGPIAGKKAPPPPPPSRAKKPPPPPPPPAKRPVGY